MDYNSLDNLSEQEILNLYSEIIEISGYYWEIYCEGTGRKALARWNTDLAIGYCFGGVGNPTRQNNTNKIVEDAGCRYDGFGCVVR